MANKHFIIGAFVFCLVAFISDFSGRLLPSYDDEGNSDKKVETAEKPSVTYLTKQQQSILNESLAAFDVEPKKEKPKKNNAASNQPKKKEVKLMSEQEQLAQRGELQGLFDGEHKYTLIATFFNDGERFAVLKQENLVSSKKANLRVNLAQAIARYKVNQIEAKYISLVDGERTVYLQLFKQNKAS